MGTSRRQEVLNVVLANLLQERGVVAAPETIVYAGIGKRRKMPDVIVNFQGLRTAIEGEVEAANAQEKALASAMRRVEDGIAHIGVAVVYPDYLRRVDYSNLKAELSTAELAIAITDEADVFGFVHGDVDYLERALRSTFEHLIREDVVAEAVGLLDEAVDRFAETVINHKGVWGRITKILGASVDEADLEKLNPSQIAANCRIAGLVFINAVVFHDMLSEHFHEVTPLRDVLNSKDADVFLKEWKYILEEINYYPIFHLSREILLSLSASAWGVPEALIFMIETASKITKKRAALRHDLMGRVYHRLLSDAKYLGTYYTSIPAATLLLKLALRPDDWSTSWDDVEQLRQLRIGDLACGTGTLLIAAADAVVDNHISASAMVGKEVKLSTVHTQLAEDVLFGYDVLPSAIHLTASSLALRTPDTPFRRMNLFSLPLGGEFRRLGSIEYLRGHQVQMPLDLFGAIPKTQQVTGKAMEERDIAPLPNLDLCVMNPPFVRSVGGNLLFGSLPELERADMQKDLRRLVASSRIKASITAGLGSVFTAIGDRHLNQGGRLALVLPKALLSGVSWGETRELINAKYRLDYVIVSHDADRWNFSESTDLSEVLVVATKHKVLGGKPPADHKVTVVNLWRNPTMALEALAIASLVARSEPPDLVSNQGVQPLSMNGYKIGEVLSYSWEEMRADWFLPCAFAQTSLVRAAYHLLRGTLWLPGSVNRSQINLCSLDELGGLGPDRRDIHDGFDTSGAPTAYPSYWGHNAEETLTLGQKPNRYLVPLAKAKKNRPLRKAEALWPLAGRILIAERMWLKTQRVVAIRLTEHVLSNVWWSFSFKQGLEKPNYDKALVMWLNSTLGLLIMFASRDETRGAWVDFKKPSLGSMPVLDVRKLSSTQLEILAAAYDRLCEKPIQPLPKMHEDEVRTEIDQAIIEALELPAFSQLTKMLAREPVVSMERL